MTFPSQNFTDFQGTIQAVWLNAVDDFCSGGVREKLTGTRTYYVRPDGSDTNTGLADTASAAFKTLQRAANAIWFEIDTSGYQVTVMVANGTYTDGISVSGPVVGGGSVYFIGNVTTPASCVVSTTGDCVKADLGAAIRLRGFKFLSASGAGVVSYRGSYLEFQKVDFGAVALSHIEVGQSSTAIADGDYTVSGGGTSHWHVGSPGLFYTSTITVTLTGTPAFSAYFAGVAEGTLTATGATFSGSATGKRYYVHKNGIIDAGPSATETTFPGNVAGEALSGGRYITVSGIAQQYKQVWSGSANFVALSGLSCGNVSGSYILRTSSGDLGIEYAGSGATAFGAFIPTTDPNVDVYCVQSSNYFSAASCTRSTGEDTQLAITAVYRLS